MKRKKWGILLAALMALAIPDATCASASDAVPLTLEESIGIALRESVLLHSAREGVAVAEARGKEAFTGFLPKFSMSYAYTRLNDPQTLNFPGSPPLIPASTIVAGTRDNFNWGLEASQPLFAGGGILASYRTSRLGEEIARGEERTAVQNLVLEVKEAYFNLLKAERLLEVAGQSVSRLQAHRDTAQGFYETGMIPRNDLLKSEVELAAGRQSLLRAENGVALARARFNTVLRRPLASPVRLAETLGYEPFGRDFAACLEEARRNRTELGISERRKAQASLGVDLAKSEYYPSLNLLGKYAKFGDTPSVGGSPYQSQESWSVTAAMQWRFWEWGKTKHLVAQSRSRESQAADAHTHLEDQIALEVKNAYLLLEEADKQIRVAERAIEQAEENLRLNTERYREQVGTSTDVIDAQTLLTRARSDHATALGDYRIGMARLERAMGTIWTGK